MNKENIYTLSQLQEIYQNIELEPMVSLNSCLTQGVATLGEKTKVLIISTNHQISIGLISKLTGFECDSVINLRNCSFEMSYDLKNSIKLITNDGKITINQPSFVNLLKKQTEGDFYRGEILNNSALLEKVDIQFIHINQLTIYTEQEWAKLLSGVDYVSFVIDSLKAFDATEKLFFKETLSKMFSKDRITVTLGNTEFLKGKDKLDTVEYINIYVQDAAVLSYIDYNDKSHIDGLQTLIGVLQELDNNSIELRSTTRRDICNYSIAKYKENIERHKAFLSNNAYNIQAAIDVLSDNNDFVTKSIDRITRKIDSFFTDYALNLFIRQINDFNIFNKQMLTKQIEESYNIENDSKYLNKYMDYTWTEFMKNVQPWLESIVAEQAVTIESMIKSDLEQIVEKMDVNTQELVKSYIEQKYNPRSFIVEKSNQNGVQALSKTMNIGAVILLLFSPGVALLTFGGSQMIKYMFKDSINLDRKEQLIIATTDMSDKMEQQIIAQSKEQFKAIVSDVTAESEKIYSNIISEIKKMLNTQAERQNKSEEILYSIKKFETELI